MYVAVPLLVAMILHEYAHGWVAHRCGDQTAKRAGRLTLNPLAHIDLVGTIIVPLMCILMPWGFFFGWAKPVPVNPRQLRDPRRDMALVAAAGPAMNLLLAIGSAVLLAFVVRTVGSSGVAIEDVSRGIVVLANMLNVSVQINILLMVFNLIPIPPLDGGRILISLLPRGPAIALSRLEPYGMFALVGLIMLDPHIRVISTILGTLVPFVKATILSWVEVLL